MDDTASMTSDVTMADEEGLAIDDARQIDLQREETMLSRKLELLDGFWRKNDPDAPSTLAGRCRLLQGRVDLMETAISQAGKVNSARQYLRSPPISSFQTVQHDEFLRWMASRDKTPARLLGQPHFPSGENSVTPTPLTREHSPIDDSVQLSSLSHRPKRVRTSAKEKSPCLRCKILKKKCDSFEQCSHCPKQGYDNESDYWKVLGCFRDPLQQLSEIFCPEFSRSASRTLRFRTGDSQVVRFILTRLPTISPQKQDRIAYLVLYQNSFRQLSDESWENIETRKFLGQESSSHSNTVDNKTVFPGDDRTLEDFVAPWSLLQAASTDPTYLGETRYNFFTLIRLGNKYSRAEPLFWKLFGQAKRLLRQAVEIYLLERLCGSLASGRVASFPVPDPASPYSANEFILVDIKPDIETFLDSFESVCSGRGKLSGHAQLACIYALLVFGVVKSVLIDAYSIRSEYEDDSFWKESHATRITSAYKVLVSIYCWSGRSDPLLDSLSDVGDPILQDAILETHILLHKDRWGLWGIKGTKDLFLSLGSCFLPYGVYNGFFVQKFGLDALPVSLPKPASASYDSDNGTVHEKQISFANNVFSTPLSRSPNQSESASSSLAERTSWAITPSSSRAPSRTPNSSSMADHPSNVDQGSLWETSSEVSSLGGTSSGTFSSFLFVPHNKSLDNAGKMSRGRRRLNPAEREKALKMRQMRACWACWLQKIPCSEGLVCTSCVKSAARTDPDRIWCSRDSFSDSSNVFFPDFLVSHLTQQAVERFVTEHAEKFNDQSLEVAVTWGAGAPMKLAVNSFIPSTNEILQQSYQDQDGDLLRVESLPVGLLSIAPSELKRVCMAHLESVLENPSYTVQTTAGHTFGISWRILESKSTLLHDALLLHMIIHFMGRLLIFTDDSATSLAIKLQTTYPKSKYRSSRLLSRQIKLTMHLINRELTKRFLSELENTLRQRSSSSWPVAFASILVLCMCIEELQTSAQAHVDAARFWSSETLSSVGLEKELRQACQQLDDVPFKQITRVFHGVFRTAREESGRLCRSNPIKDDDSVLLKDARLDEAALAMIGTVRDLVRDNGPQLHELNKPPNFEEGPEEFSKKNMGRLTSKFLLSFLDGNVMG